MRGERRYDYLRDESIVRGVWQATAAPPVPQTEKEIQVRAACTPAAAFRVWTLRRAGTMAALEYWLDGTVTLRQIEMVVQRAPFDEEDQLASLCAMSSAVRRRRLTVVK